MALNYDERFVNRLIELQPRLRAFIRSLVPFKQDADDVVQETNLVLCRKAGEYIEGSNFAAWAVASGSFPGHGTSTVAGPRSTGVSR